MGINPNIFENTKTDRLTFSEPLLRGTGDVTPKAFHVREIPVNNVIYVTDSLAVRQTSLKYFFVFLTYFLAKFCHRLRLSIEKIKSKHSGSINRVIT